MTYSRNVLWLPTMHPSLSQALSIQRKIIPSPWFRSGNWVRTTAKHPAITVHRLGLWTDFSERFQASSKCTTLHINILAKKHRCIWLNEFCTLLRHIYLFSESVALFCSKEIKHATYLCSVNSDIRPTLNNSNFICKSSFILLVHSMFNKLNKWL